MATSFPGSLDSFVNPSGSDALDSVSVPHATQHADLNDAVEALQAKVGVDGSAVTSSLDYQLANIGTWTTYTPVWTATGTNPVIGNGALVGQYTQINKLVIAQVDLTCGSTTTFGTGIWIFSLPITAATVLSNYGQIGIGTSFDSSISTHRFIAPVNYNVSTTEFIVASDQSVGAPDLSPTVPFTWAINDTFSLTLTYRAA